MLFRSTISLGKMNLLDDGDLLAAQESQEILRIVRMEITNLFDDRSLSNNQPSSQQLFWLYYGLGLKQQQIGEIIHLNFGLTNNPGSVALRLQKGRNHLFQRIHAALQNQPPQLTNREIDAAMNMILEMYFDRAIPSLLSAISLQLNSSPPAQIGRAHV